MSKHMRLVSVVNREDFAIQFQRVSETYQSAESWLYDYFNRGNTYVFEFGTDYIGRDNHNYSYYIDNDEKNVHMLARIDNIDVV